MTSKLKFVVLEQVYISNIHRSKFSRVAITFLIVLSCSKIVHNDSAYVFLDSELHNFNFKISVFITRGPLKSYVKVITSQQGLRLVPQLMQVSAYFSSAAAERFSHDIVKESFTIPSPYDFLSLAPTRVQAHLEAKL